MDKKTGFSKSQKTVIISLMIVVVLLLTSYVVFGLGNNTRTVMMYIVGSNLESDAGIVSADLAALDVNKIDLENTNVLIYTGGTKKWHNFIRNDENAIYLLTKKGFKKIESHEKKNMGDPDTFSNFLTYAYKNYKADKYDLIMYDHGGAIHGAVYDDFTGDNLDLYDFSKALSDSPFSSKNKMETVIFRTCLNGTVEVGSVFSKYAKYLVASEEVTWGSSNGNVLGFLNNVSNKDDGVKFGSKFIDQYAYQMSVIDPLDTKVITYALIDLSKIQNVIDNLNTYIDKVDIKNNYINISTLRSNSYQYGGNQEDYDMIDLYDFVSNSKSYYSDNDKTQKLLKSIDEAVIYNKTNTNNSHGLSVYFPYKGKVEVKKMFLELYNRMNKFKNYGAFINKFEAIKDEGKSFSFSFNTNKTSYSKGEVTLKLTEEQKKNYANSVYMIFKKDPELKDYYEIIYSSDDTVYKDGEITTKITNNLMKISDKSAPSQKAEFIPSFRRVHRSNKTHTLNAILYDQDKTAVNEFVLRATISITEKDGEPVFSTVIRNSDDTKLDGMLLNIKDFEILQFPKTRVKLFDKNKKLIKGNWETSSEKVLYEIKTKDIKLNKANLDDNGEYYCLFRIFDNNNNDYYSNLIKIK